MPTIQPENDFKATWISAVLLKLKDQTISFLLIAVVAWGLFSMVQDHQNENRKQMADFKKESNDCDEYIRTVMFKAIEANTIVINRSNETDISTKELLLETKDILREINRNNKINYSEKN